MYIEHIFERDEDYRYCSIDCPMTCSEHDITGSFLEYVLQAGVVIN